MMIGDVVGSTGRRLLKEKLPKLKKSYAVDLCLANGENAAAGLGLTPRLASELCEFGVDLITLGNHTWFRRELVDRIDTLPQVIRPANGPAAWPGQGFRMLQMPGGPVLVVNLLGRVFMEPLDDPFAVIDRILQDQSRLSPRPIVVVDFHAEATAEKIAMGYYLDGRVTLLAGTHTHVQTADERILPNGTAYITDVGMTGPIDGVIGMDRDASLRRLVNHLPAPYDAASGRGMFSAVVVAADLQSGRATGIQRILIQE
jgi:metallophosphoesterase (TIGR00282 family)